jgi:glutamyl-tRNA synthetase
VPLLLNPDRTKLSKRQGDVAVEDYIKKGYSKEALINFVALLGWNPGSGSEQEIFTMQELLEQFSLEHVGKSGAIFNLEKLSWIEKQHIRRLSNEELARRIKPILLAHLKTKPSSLPLEQITSEVYLMQVAELMKERVDFIHEFVTFSSYFFFDPERYEEEAIKKRWQPETNAHLAAFCECLRALPDFTASHIEQALKDFTQAHGIKTSDIVHPVRLAVTGMSFGASLYHTLEVLGKDTVLRRLERAIAQIKPDKVT